MAIRQHFGVIQKEGFAEINLVEDSKTRAIDSILLLKNATKIQYADPVKQAYAELQKSGKPIKELKEIVASDLRSRSEDQIGSRTKFFDSILSFLFSCFGYESTQKKIEVAFSLIKRKEYEENKEPKPESPNSPKADSPKSPEKKYEEKVEDEQPKNSETDDSEKESKAQAEREAKEKAEREAKEKADQESKAKAEIEKAEKEAQAKAESEAKEKSEQEARMKAEQEARIKAELEAKEKAEKEAKDKAAAKAKEEFEKEQAFIKLKQQLQEQAKLKQEQAALKEELAKIKDADKENNAKAKSLIAFNLNVINAYYNNGDVDAILNIVRSFPRELADLAFYNLTLEYAKINFSLARFFSFQIIDPSLRDKALAEGHLSTVDELIVKSQKSDHGKSIAELIENTFFEKALKEDKNETFKLWILDSAIRFYINAGNGNKAQSYIDRVLQEDLKRRYSLLYIGKYHLQLLTGYLSNYIPRDPNAATNIIQALQFIRDNNINDAIKSALTLPTDVLTSFFIPKLVEFYIDKKQFLEARDIVPLINERAYNKDSILQDIAAGQIEKGQERDALETLKLLKSDSVKETLINTYSANTALALTVASTLSAPSQAVYLKMFENAPNEEEAFKILPFITDQNDINWVCLVIGARFGNFEAFVNSRDEAQMIKFFNDFASRFMAKNGVNQATLVAMKRQADQFKSDELKSLFKAWFDLMSSDANLESFLTKNEKEMEALIGSFNHAFGLKNIPNLPKDKINELEAKVDALASKNVKKALYQIIRSLYASHGPDLKKGNELIKKIKELA